MIARPDFSLPTGSAQPRKSPMTQPMCQRRSLLAMADALALALAGNARAETNSVKISVILPMTGSSASTGKQIDAAIKPRVAPSILACQPWPVDWKWDKTSGLGHSAQAHGCWRAKV